LGQEYTADFIRIPEVTRYTCSCHTTGDVGNMTTRLIKIDKQCLGQGDDFSASKALTCLIYIEPMRFMTGNPWIRQHRAEQKVRSLSFTLNPLQMYNQVIGPV